MRLGLEAALVDGELVMRDLAVDGGVVTAVGLARKGRGVAVPGLVDLQVNGYAESISSPSRSGRERSRTPSLRVA